MRSRATSYINMTRRYLAAMRARGAGVIVNDIGTGGDRVDYDYIAGAGGNASLMAFTRAIGGRSIHFGVRVLGVNPGPVETDRIQAVMRAVAEENFGDPDRASEYYANWPMQRFAKPEDAHEVHSMRRVGQNPFRFHQISKICRNFR